MSRAFFWRLARSVGLLFLVAFAIGYLIVLFYLLVVLIEAAFPAWISGETAGSPNHVRNALELVYFAANSLVALFAVGAIQFARKQAKEAEHARLASIYTAIEARWSSPTITASRVTIRKLMVEVETQEGVQVNDPAFPRHFDRKLVQVGKGAPMTYIRALGIVDFIEYVGVMEARGYLDLEVLDPLIGEVAVSAYEIFGPHIQTLQTAFSAKNRSQGLNNVPPTYAYFVRLAQKFQSRFR